MSSPDGPPSPMKEKVDLAKEKAAEYAAIGKEYAAAGAQKAKELAGKVLAKDESGGYLVVNEAKARYQAIAARGAAFSKDILDKADISQEDLSKLHRIPAVVSLASLVIGLLLIFSHYNTGWVRGMMWINGEVYEAYVSTTTAELGKDGADSDVLKKYFDGCGSGLFGNGKTCALSTLCAGPTTPYDKPEKSTPDQAWCDLEDAGGLANTLLTVGLIPGLGTFILTFIFAAKEIGKVGLVLSKAESQGISMTAQKYIIAGCWIAFWGFLFVSMVAYAATVPDTLGVGLLTLEASFGVVRLSFLLVTVFGALLIVTLFDLWRPDGFIEAWMEFSETPCLSAKKALYIELMLQLACYLAMFVDEVKWEMLLVVICAYYVDAKVKNFMVMYVVLTTASILFDLITLNFMPQDWQVYTPGQAFTHGLFMVVLILKFLILGTIYLYEKENDGESSGWKQMAPDPEKGEEDEIAE